MSASVAVARFGDRALRFVVPPGAQRAALLTALRALPGVVDVVLAEEVGAVIFGDSAFASASAAGAGERVEGLEALLASALLAHVAAEPVLAGGLASPPPRVIRVVYDGDDLAPLAARLDVTVDELIALHTAPDYEVAMVGFMPGFAYLRGLDRRLVVERRDAPRARVPARSVAIAAGYTGIYPFASPGGWHLLGEALDFEPFDARGVTLPLGTRVRFERAEGKAREARNAREARGRGATASAVTAPSGAGLAAGSRHLEVRAVRGFALLVDGGRFGHMHEGVPHGGPLVQRALARANARAGNSAGTCAIEVYGSVELVARGGAMLVAGDAGEPRTLADGEVFAIACDGSVRARYVAVFGGIDVPVVLDGRGTMLAAGMGGFEGRGVRRGDWLRVGRAGAGAGAGAGASAGAGAGGVMSIRVVVGPDPADLSHGEFTISATSNRTGTRLEGPPVDFMQSARDRRSTPMVLGAIEATPAGLVVLGPDHPTTGGYPVVGVVSSSSLDDFFELPVGHRIRFDPRT